MSAQPQPAVDTSSPWLGLASYTEETRGYFHGREEEVAELARRVQRKLLTVLFGQSGLGKTSILRAGIVPRLRPEGYCPVYVRIDYSPESPPPSEQIKQAIFRATESSGQWTQPGTAVAGESLWEFLHHRDDILRDASGKTVIPLLIFDQFEEIFTIAQGDAAGRARAAQFIEDLADLVENRPPKALEARIETDDEVTSRFDFSRADYRILIALREDYLAHLESVKGAMPSITQNRMRLARMTGSQALAAVVKPGGRLVSQEVAEAIVRFVAGGAELRNAEVEPSLLSLICRELNSARIAQGRPEISADLLAGSHDTILKEFYERALEDQPAAVGRFIEDEMLTESGFRESLAEERVVKGFAAAGAKPDALATLVNRRLLRIEERLDLRRVELTHDVLCTVVLASRDMRHEREARDAAERQLAEQKAREEATRKALVRARQVAVACAVLAIAAVVSAIFGYQNMQRAREAEAAALKTRTLAESARSEAEKLVVYLLDDFYLELEPIGRLDIVADLAKRAVDYYDALPRELRTPETERNRALALVRQGTAMRTLSRTQESDKALTEAIRVLGELREKGDRSEATAIGLGLALAGKGRLAGNRNLVAEELELSQKGAAVLAPLVAAPNASIALRRAYGYVSIALGFAEQRRGLDEQAVKTLEASRAAFRSIDGLKVGDLASAAGYAEATAWLLDALQSLDRTGDARGIAEDALKVAGQVLAKSPSHMGALRSRALVSGSLGGIEAGDLRLKRGIKLAESGVRDWEDFLKLDPGNSIAWNNLSASRQGLGFAFEAIGRPADGARNFRAAVDVQHHVKLSTGLIGNLAFASGQLARLEADLGNPRAAQAALEESRRLADLAVHELPAQSFIRLLLERVSPLRFEAALAHSARDFGGMREAARAAIVFAEKAEPASEFQKRMKLEFLALAHRDLAEASYRLKDYPTAEQSARKAIAFRRQRGDRSLLERTESIDAQILLATILARQGRPTEVREALEPVQKYYRELPAGIDDQFLQFWRARVKLAEALAAPGQAHSLLAEAAALVDGLPPDMRRTKSTTIVREEIAREQQGKT